MVEWIRSLWRSEPPVIGSVTLLEHLKKEYPHIPEEELRESLRLAGADE
jgi:hypothetical protein